jgi:lipid-A-disaccharide synthase
LAGEASGDLHGSNLLKEIKLTDTSAVFRGFGGDLMQAQGMHLIRHIKQLAFMGFSEVVLNLGTILKNISDCKKDILLFQPDVLVLVDYPGFNLRIAKWAHKKGIKTVYYISPQIWAWNRSRVHKIKRIIDRMLVILPFEKAFYKDYGMNVDFVGHPLLDAIAHIQKSAPDFRAFCTKHKLSGKPIIALLPGSRKQEIQVMLPVFLKMCSRFPQYEFVVAGAPSQDAEYYQHYLKNNSAIFIANDTYGLLQQSTAAIVSSGTATLETALFDVPQVVCYKGNFISYAIARQLIKVKFISLVNLIMNREIVKELIQFEFNPEKLETELHKILPGKDAYNSIKESHTELRNKLGNIGASARAACVIIETAASR